MTEIDPTHSFRKSVINGGQNARFARYIQSLQHEDGAVREDAIRELCIGWGYCITVVPELLTSTKEVFIEMGSNNPILKEEEFETYLPKNFQSDDPNLVNKANTFLGLYQDALALLTKF